MTGKYTESKLLLMSKKDREMLDKIQQQVLKTGANVSTNQIIRDMIRLVICMYRNEIIELYRPRKIDELVQKKEGENHGRRICQITSYSR